MTCDSAPRARTRALHAQRSYYFVDAGMMAANAHLFAAAAGLAAWFHNCDREGMAAALGLPEDRRVLFGQTFLQMNSRW